MTSLADLPGEEREGKRLLAVLVYACLMVSVVSTLGAPLIPEIARDHGISLASATWMLTVTLLVGAVATPVMGRLGDGPGRRGVLMGGLAVVCVGSLVAATASSFGQLLAGRALQGIGYGTVPLAIAIAREHLPAELLRRGIATLSVTVAVGAGLGFPATGLVAQDLDYHVAFWIAAAITALGVVLVARTVPRGAPGARREALDGVGALGLGLGLGALLLAISQGETWGWGSARVLALLVGAALVFAAWGRWELRAAHPLVDLRISALPTVLAANITGVLMGFGMYVVMTLVLRLAQTPASAGYGFASSLFVTGLLLVPLSFGSFIASGLARRLAARAGMRVVIPIGVLVVVVAQLGLALQHEHLYDLLIATALLGVGIGCTFAAMPALIVAAVPPGETGSASSVNQVTRVVGGALGSAVAATILAAHTAGGSPLPTEGGFGVTFVVGAVVCGLTIPVVLLLLPKGIGRRGAPVPERGSELELLMEEEALSGVGPVAVEEPHRLVGR